MKIHLALVHHANQYLITNGYDNREGLSAVLGTPDAKSGLAYVLDLHRRYRIPLNFHVSGTLLEAIAWHQPDFLDLVHEMLEDGLIELVGSCYGQNIMRFFGAEYNRRQLNEELHLYRDHLRIDPQTVKVFWPPERVWETKRMAGVLRDAALLNDGYKYVILDDRLLLQPKDSEGMARGTYDEKQQWRADLFQMYEIEDGLGLSAFPIATRLRRSIPPQKDEDWKCVEAELEALLVHASSESGDVIALYADDMEKVAGIGEWGTQGPERYEAFLTWMTKSSSWLAPVRLTDWASRHSPTGKKPIQTGTFQELAQDFDAGEGYERWYLAPDWAPYRGYFTWADRRVRDVESAGGDPQLLQLAEKQLLVGNWETAWHTPGTGPHGDPNQFGHASPWARALTSHSRHAGVMAEAAAWRTAKDGSACVDAIDVDNDGEIDVVLKNSHLFAVVTPRWGGRVVAMFSVSGDRGVMVVGNPCDDWNWMEELNKYMETPRNHPGAFADVGFENDQYDSELLKEGDVAILRLTNIEEGSQAKGLIKEYRIGPNDRMVTVRYVLPRKLRHLSTEFGLSPDYLRLLRHGSRAIQGYRSPRKRGFANGDVRVWVRPHAGLEWEEPYQYSFGHGCVLRLGSSQREFEVELGVTRLPLDPVRVEVLETVEAAS